MFDQTIALFRESSDSFEKHMNNCVARLLTEVTQIDEQMTTLFEKPFKTINFNISNELYEEYESKEVITQDSVQQFNKMLR